MSRKKLLLLLLLFTMMAVVLSVTIYSGNRAGDEQAARDIAIKYVRTIAWDIDLSETHITVRSSSTYVWTVGVEFTQPKYERLFLAIVVDKESGTIVEVIQE